jgi:PAS domain-containing protein
MRTLALGGSVVFVWLLLVGGLAGLTSKRLEQAARDLLASQEELARVTERKKADEQFKTLVESAPDAVIVTDKESRIFLVNAEAERLYGYSRNELIGAKARR